ncbi:MAG: hypothetical protein ACRC5T_03615 [Cetobacterium sp.]
MTNIDPTWVKEQLTEAKLRRKIGDSVLVLLEAWDKINAMEDKDADEVIAVFARLASGHALVVENATEAWTPARPGALTVGDVVRVKSDAFSGRLGTVHNGRVGTIIAIRYGDIIVNSTDDKEPKIDGAHYSPLHLEKRV